jgi:uncharacterized OB-fold protein
MTDFPEIKVPRPDELDLEFYQAIAKAGVLHVQRCNAAARGGTRRRITVRAARRAITRSPRPAGRANVYSYTVSHMSVEPQWQARVPYVTIVAELDEGPRLVAAASDIPADKSRSACRFASCRKRSPPTSRSSGPSARKETRR